MKKSGKSDNKSQKRQIAISKGRGAVDNGLEKVPISTLLPQKIKGKVEFRQSVFDGLVPRTRCSANSKLVFSSDSFSHIIAKMINL